MTDIYAQHDAAFANVSAFLVMRGAVRVAKVAIKHGAAVTVYVHQIGSQMVRARACGGGYDRASAAVAAAVAKLEPYDGGYVGTEFATWFDDCRAAMQAAIPAMDSGDWTRALEKQGFIVLQAV